MPLTIANADAFAPLLDTPATISGADFAGAYREVKTKVVVSASNPYAENLGGAARSEAWSVACLASVCDPHGRDWPRPGSYIAFPNRPDLPRLFIQRSWRLGALVQMSCSSSERGPK